MRRVETYVGQQVYEWLFSAQAQNNMTALAKVCSAVFGTGPIVNGLACTPTLPATMTVQIGAGEIYQVAPLEATTCGTLPANTANTILKQGIQLNSYTTATFAAPGTSGQSIAYLIEAQYQDSDISLDPTSGTSPVVLQFYNAANPSQPWSGPNNSGSTSNTFRDGVVAYQIKAGAAATTGSQVTPSPDTGWVGLWVVTVPYGATSLTAGNISQYAGAPFLSAALLQQIQSVPTAGRLLKTTVFTSSGTFNSLPNTNSVRLRGGGGGASGGPVAASSSTQISVSSGGASGNWGEAFLTTGFSGGIAVTIGAGGVGTTSAGAAGGTTLFAASTGAVSFAGGGYGGSAQISTSVQAVAAPIGPAGGITGSPNIYSAGGMPGSNGIAFGPPIFAVPGTGGTSLYGGGGPGNGTGAGGAGSGHSSGGGGAAAAPSTGPFAGGAGTGGILIVEEYA